MINVESWNATQIVPIHLSEYFFLLLKCIEIDLGKINYYLSHSNLESKKYLINSEFV